MEYISLDRHPIRMLMDLGKVVDHAAVISFSRYIYMPQNLIDSRVVFDIPLGRLTDDWLMGELKKLHPNEELALNSTVRMSSGIYHIPMIDFAGLSPDHFGALAAVFGESVESEFAFYSSGRSFHAYGRSNVLSEPDWHRFMGKLLLCNLPGKTHVVDQRWVGHRLIGGYSSLRWSCNSPRYKQYPTLVGDMSQLSGLTKKKKKLRLSE